MQVTRILRRPLAWSFFVLGAAVTHAACGGGDATGPTRTAPTSTATTVAPIDSSGPVATTIETPDAGAPVAAEEQWDLEYDPAACHGSLAQCDQHAADAVDALQTLVDVEQTNDKRSVPLGIDAVTNSTDAELVSEGLRIIGHFSREPGVYQATLPRIIDPRPVIRHLAARILNSTSEGNQIARQYEKGHGTSALEGVPSNAHDPPRPVATWGFAPLANAKPYPPGDGPTSLGFATTASVEEVASFYAQQPGAKRMGARDFAQMRSKAMADASTGPEMKQIQAIQEQMMKTHRPPDAATMQKMKELGDQMQKRVAATVDPTPYPTDAQLIAGQLVVLTQTGAVPDRWVAIYREPLFDRTIAILAWTVTIAPTPMPAPFVLRGVAR